jgi:hypothetical protein
LENFGERRRGFGGKEREFFLGIGALGMSGSTGQQ